MLASQPCPYIVCPAQALTAQAWWEAHSKGEDGYIRPLSLEIIKHLYKNKSYADAHDIGITLLLLTKF